MRVLWLASEPPWPPTSGGRLANSGLIGQLAELAHVTVCALVKDPAERTALFAAHSAWGGRIETVALARPTHGRPARRTTIGAAAEVLGRLELAAPDRVWLRAARWGRRLGPLLAEVRPDAVIASDWSLLGSRLPVPAGVLVSEIMADRLGWPLGMQSPRRRAELRALAEADAVATVTDHDARRLMSLGVPQAPVVLRPPVPLPERAARTSTQAVGMIANYRHEPNREALQVLLEDVWPRVRADRPSAELVLAGAHMPPVTGPGVVALGTIGDVGDFYRRVRVVVVPVSSGTGIRMKALEALAHGVGVVATPRGAEGLEGCRAVQSRPLTDMPAALGAALDCSAGAQGETARRWIRENHGPVAARSSLQALLDRLAHA